MVNQTLARRFAPAVVCLIAGAGIGRAFAPGHNLYINGQLASSRVIDHDGAAYAPIADVAHALNLGVASRADGYSIDAAGGANPVSGLSGKVGDTLNSGQATFTIVKAFRTDHYTKQFDSGDSTPGSANEDLVVVVCRVKNALPKTFILNIMGGGKTALTDQDSHSYNAGRFNSDFRSGAPDVLPGSAVDFALVYSIPKTEKVGDMVYELAAGGGVSVKPAVFRISLASVNQ